MRVETPIIAALVAVPSILLPLHLDPPLRSDHLARHQEVDGRSNAAAPAAQWFLDHLRDIGANGGTWMTDFRARRSESEPYDEYGVEWTLGLGGMSAKGRLFAVDAGREVGSFWEFRMFWHPGEGRARLLQWGSDGSFGEGEMRPIGKGAVEIEQVFHAPDGSRTEVRHEADDPGSGEHEIRAFDRQGGEWKMQRAYLWVRS